MLLVALAWRAGVVGEVRLEGTGSLFGVMKALTLMVVMVAQLCEYTINP